MVMSILQFGWESKQAIIVSMISIGISDSNLLAVIEFLTHKLENIKMRIFCLGRYTTNLKKMDASVEAATC